MKRILFAVWLAALISPDQANADLANRDFERGDLGGWSFHADVALLFPRNGGLPGFLPVSTAMAVTSFSFGQTSPIQAEAGNWFAAFEIGQGNLIFFTDSQYDSFLSQSVVLHPGDVVSGWARFADGDSIPQDSAWVRIRNSAGELVAKPWDAESGNNPAFDPRIDTPWTLWQWQADTEDTYTLQLGVTTGGDILDPSEAFFDEVSLIRAMVPEPQAGAVMLLGLAGGWLRPKRTRR